MNKAKQPHSIIMRGKKQPIAGHGKEVAINWMFENALAELERDARPPKSLTATITTEDGYTYTGVVYLVEEQAG
jgi:hypothetical protein